MYSPSLFSALQSNLELRAPAQRSEGLKTAFGSGEASRVTVSKTAFGCIDTALTSSMALGTGAESVTAAPTARVTRGIRMCILVYSSGSSFQSQDIGGGVSAECSPNRRLGTVM